MHNFCINDFEGPLDLLLHLIKVAKMDIYEINTAEIINQYLDYIHHLEHQNIDVASEYLVMAAELVHLKSKMLINAEDEEPTNDFTINSEAELKAKLIAYQKYQEITNNFKELADKRSEVYTKYPTSLNDYWDETINLEKTMDVTDLINAFQLFKERQKFAQPLQTTITKKEIAVSTRIQEIRKLFNNQQQINFFDLFSQTDKPYIIVTFLAILEMSKNNEILLKQDNNFSDIIIEKRGSK
ncbi:MAG TPA: segregation/condensation protein A [Bacilli bacterium]|nr:segregation/condensation protein A [Bacilli bacterium]